MIAAIHAGGAMAVVAADPLALVLLRAAAIMRRNREELAAWMVYEVSKSWGEADADVAEAMEDRGRGKYHGYCFFHHFF